MKFSAIVVAAGSGTRFGGPKHDLMLAGMPVWRHAVELFQSVDIDEIVVVGDVEGGIPGGARRRDSVAAGISAVSSTTDWVLVHDAARPVASTTLVRRVIDAARTTDADGVIPAMMVTDTLKEVAGSTVVATVDRSRIASVQTPQAFRLSILRRAHEVDPDLDATDDAGLIEHIGGTVVTVPGEQSNIKITFEGDLAIAAILMERRPHE